MNKPCNKCKKSIKFKGKCFPSSQEEECRNCNKVKKYYDYLENKRKYAIGEKIKELKELELLVPTWILLDILSK